jgi:AcrR family transcriptional regulator
MSPRPYSLGKRREHIDETRRHVLEAARAMLAEATTYTAFTVEAVAKRADVARATVYYQFGSKTGLLEALCDTLAEAGGMGDLAKAFTEADARRALRAFIDVFGRFWAADRMVTRRLRALAALDPDVAKVIGERDERRGMGLAVLVDRLAADPGVRLPAGPEQAVRVLHALTSFETFDALAGTDRDPIQVVPLVAVLAEAALELPRQRAPRRP